MGLLYLIHFGDLSRFYVGATTLRACDRRANHIKALKRGRSGPLLQAEWDRCGRAAFTFIPLLELNEPLLSQREAEMILKLRPALNVVTRYAPLAAKVGCHPETLKRRIARGVDPSVQTKRINYGRAAYRCRAYDVGEAQPLTVKQIADRAGLKLSRVYKRIATGVRGPALLAR